MTLKAQIINAIATAMALGIGSTVVSLKVNDARQDTRIERIETLNANVKDLSNDLQTVDRHLSTIDGKLQQQEIDRGR